MIFTAYIDESDTHGPAPTVIMSAFLASTRQWELFERRLRVMQCRYGFKVLHAKSFRDRKGEFAGWSRQKQSALVNDFTSSIRDHLLEGVTIILPRESYEAAYRAPPVPKGMPLDSQYGVCFRLCLYRLLYITRAQKGHNRLRVVIEDGHANVSDTCRIFGEVKAEFHFYERDILRTMTIAKKPECPLLMVADFQAHASSISEARQRAGQPGYYDMAPKVLASHERPLKNIHEAILTQFEPDADTLRGLKDQWQRVKEDKFNKWRDAKVTRGASPAS